MDTKVERSIMTLVPLSNSEPQWLDAALQDAGHVGDGDAVVREGDVLVVRAFGAVVHFTLRQHATAAMDDDGVAGQIVRKTRAAREFELHILSAMLADQFRKLFRADVAALAVMRAAFGNQDDVAVAQAVQCFHAADGSRQIAFVAGEKNGERCQRNILGDDLRDFSKYLAVRYYQLRRSGKSGERQGQFRLFCHDADGVAVENVAKRLDLREDETAFGRGGVNGRHENDDVARFDQIADDAVGIVVLRGGFRHELLQIMDALACHGADGDCRQAVHGDGRRRQIRLVDGDDAGYLLGFDQLEDFGICRRHASRRVDDHDGQIRFVQHLAGLAHAQGAELRIVVQTGRVEHHDRA